MWGPDDGSANVSRMRARLLASGAQWWSVALGLLVGVLWQLETWLGHVNGSRAALAACGVGAAIGMAGVRWAGFQSASVAAASVVLAFVQPSAATDIESISILALVVPAVYGSLCLARERLIGLAVLVGVSFWVGLRIPASDLAPTSRTATLVGSLVQEVLIWGLGWMIASRVRTTQALRARTIELERERERVAESAVAEERARIARELHDVVAHNVTVMVVQAGGVRRLLGADQARERDALETIEAAGRRALAEMRRMVGVMRNGNEPADREPQPGLAGLDRLLDQFESAGLPAELEVVGTPVDLAPGLDLSAYRIVQEGLTNALRHAGPARAVVRLSYSHDAVDVEVSDNGTSPKSEGQPGHGLIGMRERVALFGGKLDAGPQPGGGFRVHARLPLEAEPVGVDR
jgi:signal transduction histidine kinase